MMHHTERVVVLSLHFPSQGAKVFEVNFSEQRTQD